MYSFEKNRFDLSELSIHEHLLHVDSTTMDKAEERDSIEVKANSKEENLRNKVDTVGK